MAVPVSNVDLMERVSQLTNKIYREILFIRRCEGITFITMVGLGHVQTDVSTCLEYNSEIGLSWNLLGWMSVESGIFSSFTNFITTPELSGHLYVRPDICHTQITEYMLEKIYRWALFPLHRTPS